MERLGEITGVNGEWLEITFCRETDCGHCHACMGTKKETTLKLRGKGNVGDCAVVEMGAATVTKASAIAYAIPLAGMLIGMGLGVLLFPKNQDVAGAVGCVLGIGAGLGIIAYTERKRSKDPRWTPELKEVIPGIAKKKEAE